MGENIKRKFNYHGNIKCDCGDKQKDHFLGEGWCDKCGCTWFYPNVYYIKRKKKKLKCQKALT